MRRKIKIPTAGILLCLFISTLAFSEPVQVQYGYDDLNRLTHVEYTKGTTIEYTYDAVGNRSSRQVYGTLTSYPGTLSLSSNPSGANILINDINIGRTTPAELPLQAGTHTIKLTLSGYQDWYGTATVATGLTTYVYATLIPIGSNTLFSDDFNDNNIDLNKWIYGGNRVAEEDNIMKVETTVTDHGGSLYSKWIDIDSKGTLTITRRVKVHYANDYFDGSFQVCLDQVPEFTFGVSYANYAYSGMGEIPKFGFFLYRKNANPHVNSDQGNVSERIEPVWNQWFDEKIIYYPTTGMLEYFINGEKKREFNVGVLPVLDSYKIRLSFGTWGWDTGHYQHFDDINVVQGTPTPQFGTITITSIPSGARIYLDDIDTGSVTTHTFTNNIQDGTHTIKLTLSGYNDWYGTRTVTAGSTTYIYATLTLSPPTTGSLTITSTPPGAKIYLDVADTGSVTTRTFTNIPTGTHTIKLTLSGYYDWYGTATVSAGLTTYVYATLTPIPTTQVVIQPGPEDGKDIWTTSVYSYAPGGGGPGGGLDNEWLKVGGWADLYYTLIEFDLTGLPSTATSAKIEFFVGTQTGYGATEMYIDRITEFWDWKTQGTGLDRERLWWADRPSVTQWISGSLPAPTVEQWYSIDITDLYNAWQNGTYPNYGVQLRPVSTNNRWNEFYSSNYMDNPSLRPKLVLTAIVTHKTAIALEITPASATLTTDGSISFTAIARDIDGNTWTVTSSTAFTENDPIGTMSNNVYYPGKVGTWTITATYSSVVAYATITVTQSTATLQYGTLTITSTPPCAKIYLDVADTGSVTTRTLTNISAGTHTIKLTLSGYYDWSGTATVSAGLTTNVCATLTQISTFSTTLAVFPETKAAILGSTFTLQINLSDVPDFDSVGVYLSFDPQILEVISLTQGAFPQGGGGIIKEFNNGSGTIDYAVGLTSGTDKGSGTVLTILFNPKAQGTTTLNFDFIPPRKTEILNGINSIPFNHKNGTITVRINNPPVAIISAPVRPVKVNDLVTLDGSGSYDPDGNPITYYWKQIAGPQITITNPNTATITFTPMQVGNYTFELTVTDDKSASGSAGATVIVTDTLLSISPAGIEVGIQNNFNLDVVLSKAQEFDSVGVYLSFDPNMVEVTGLTQGPFPAGGGVIISQFNNGSGTIDYAVGLTSGTAQGTGTVLTIGFKAKAITGTTTLTFNFNPPRNTEILKGTASVPVATTEGKIIIVPYGSLEGYVLFDIPRQNPHSGIEISIAGTDLKATTTNTGYFLINNVMPMTYSQVFAYAPGASPRYWGSVTITAGAKTTLATLTLLNADANGDRMVSLPDFGYLKLAFLKTSASAGWYDSGYHTRNGYINSDFNGDTMVSLPDFGYLKLNFLHTTTPNRSPLQGLLSEHKVLLNGESAVLKVVPEKKEVLTGDEFDINIDLLHTPEFDSAGVYLSFDPQILEVINLTPGSLTQGGSELIRQFNNGSGTIDYAVGLTSGTKQGTGTVLTIKLKAKGTGTTTLNFDFNPPRNTEILNGITPVTLFTQIGTITITAPIPELASVTITSATSTVEMLGSQSFTAQAFNQDNNPIAGATYTWTLKTLGMGILDTTIGQTVVFTATKTGTVDLQVVAGFGTRTATATATITVVNGVVHYIKITPATATIEARGTASFTAKAYNQYDYELTEVTKFDWRVAEGSGTITGSPGQTVVLTTNDVVGTLTLTVSTNTVTGTSTVEVIHGSVTSVSITPTASVEVEGSQTFVASSLNRFGHPIPASKLNYTWGLINSLGGSITPTTVSATTTFTAGTKTGEVEITAEAEGKRATATVTVTPGVIEKLVFVEPTADTLTVGMPRTMSVQTQDRFGNPSATNTTIIVSGDANSRFAEGAIWATAGTFSIAGTSNLTFFFKQNGTTTAVGSVTITATIPTASVTHTITIEELGSSSSGTVVGDDGQTTVEIGTGTLLGEGYIEINTTPGTTTETEEANKKILRLNGIEGSLREFTLNGLTMGTVTIGIPYPDSNPEDGYVDGVIPPMQESSLAVYHLVGTGTQARWEAVTSWVDPVNNVVYADVSGFSFYTLMGAGFEQNLEKALVYPNPYYPSKGHTVIYFDRLTENSTIQIFTIAGELVCEIPVNSPQEKWDACNSASEKVASGIYIYLIKDPAGNKKTGKLGVIR